MKKKIGFIIGILAVIAPTLIHTQTMSDYCSISPFVTRTVPPNILIVLDNSAAMLSPAYPLTDHYDSSSPTFYIGYFDTQGSYCAATELFYETSGSCEPGDKGPYPGALLNWATMSRYDMLLYLLAGGLGVSESDSHDLKGDSLNRGWTKTTPQYPHCEFTMSADSLSITGPGCSLQDPGTRIIVSNGRKLRGLIPGLVDRNNDGAWDAYAPRIAVMNFESSQNDIAMSYCTSGTNSLHSLYRAIASATPNETNPQVQLGKAILRTIEFHKNTCPACGACADPIDTVLCRKNFVITISSGDATDIPSLYSSGYLDEEIRKAHTEDIRADRNGTQVIRYFNINISGSANGKDIMRGFSRFGGFFDTNGNRFPDLPHEWDRNDDRVPDTYFEASDPASIRASLERAFSDISSQSASGTAVSVLSAGSGGAGGIVQAHFLPVRQDASREVLWTGHVKNIWSDPDRNLREDSVNDRKLILSQDKIVKYFFDRMSNESKAALFGTLSDGSGGSFSSCSNPEIRESSLVSALWEAGKSLAICQPSARKIFTSKRVLRDNIVTHTFPEVPYPVFQTNMNSVLLRALNPDATYSADSIIRYVRGECLETGVTGDSVCTSGSNPAFRDRRLTVDGVSRVWKLGDIMNSTPKVFTGMPLNAYHADYADRSYYEYIADSRYRRKSSVVFTGANDGMIHAFRSGHLTDKGLTGGIKAILKNFFDSGDNEHDRLGEEIWAYIPFNAFPYLKYLSDPNYCHINYSDLPARVFDASFIGGHGAGRDQHSWRTVLLGGMRFGGACGTGGNPSDPPAGAPTGVGFSSYFALDVTIPERPVPLWEFSDDDMGYATSAPAVVRTGGRMQNGQWYVVFGSGSKVLPKEGNDIGRSTPGYLYILDLGAGDLVKKVTLDHPAIVGDIIAIDADRDYATEKIYFGTSYKTGASWMGKMTSLNVQAVLEASGVNVVWNSSFGNVLFAGNYPFTASPEAARDIDGNTWVYGGSGKYFSDTDEADASPQIVIGLRDKNYLISETALHDATNLLTSGHVTGTDRVCTYDAEANSFGFREIVTSIQPTSVMLTDTDPGWKIYLPERERVISRPAAVGGILDFLTYKPDSDPCTYGGDSYIYSVSYTTGQAPARIAIRSPGITTGTSGNITVLKSINLGRGAPPAGDAIMIQPLKDESEPVQKNIQLASEVIAGAENHPLFSIVSKTVHLLKK
jgi:type IV pilus assembly protein PilY1